MNRSFSWMILTLLVLGCTKTSNREAAKPATGTTDNGAWQPYVRQLSVELTNDLKNDSIDGSISAAVLKGNRVIWSSAFGSASSEKNIPADTSTIYRAGSIAKTFTATLMMLLVEDGVIKLTDPVEQYLPEIKDLKDYSAASKITFLQLASHTAGLAREPELKDAASGPIETWEYKVLASIPTTSLQSKPGEKFSYSNIGYGILGLALSRAAKQPYMDLIRDRIFAPLNMQNSFFIVPAEKMKKLATGIARRSAHERDVETPRAEHAGRGYKVPNGGIYTTPNDMAKFVMALMGTRPLLKPSSLEEMTKVQVSGETDYGLGLMLLKDGNVLTAGHSGSVAGYDAQMTFLLHGDYGVIIMRNYNGGSSIWKRCHLLLKSLAGVKDPEPGKK